MTPVARRSSALCAILLAAQCFAVTGSRGVANGAPGPTTTSSPTASAPLTYCPLNAYVRELDDSRTRYAVSFRALETGRASGTVALWAGDRRFDVPFRDAVALDSRDAISPETSFTVRFPAPTELDGAVVTAIDEGGTLRPCDPWFSPWVRPARTAPDYRTAAQRTTDERFLSRARAATAISAPPAISDPVTCATPTRSPRTIRAVEPDRPRSSGTGIATVLVLLDPTDKVTWVRILRSAGDRRLDDAALAAASRSEYQGQIFRCRHVMGGYLFTVEFN